MTKEEMISLQGRIDALLRACEPFMAEESPRAAVLQNAALALVSEWSVRLHEALDVARVVH